ncbi:DUF2065 domain-containing protein [Thalassomonas sp. M1454]|uniref:DUF2065 domain-containing protein n=1 Tax=Thalassomonas sp. M1454 TaxID=2594477 RepID=UPI00117CDF5A|nr:DUF2065 domain-containing protein [Thalassomonas sp. M1454]TRX57874.1 DUF2065 domain-containing protein [Thalassomonas sp. M1454]
MTLSIVITALALMLIFEGIGPFFFPNRWQEFMSKLAKENPKVLRQMGGALLLIGFMLLFFNQ